MKLTDKFKERFPDKDVWCWTGYDFDKDILNKMYKENELTQKLLSNIDIIVDGTYEEDKKMIDLIARGSYNQKKIDVQESIKSGKTVVLKFGDESRFEGMNSKPKSILIKEYIAENTNNNRNIVPVINFVQGSTEINEEHEIFKVNKEIEKISAESIKLKLDREKNIERN